MQAPLILGLETTYADQLTGLYVPVVPRGFPNPKLIELNRPLVEQLGLDLALVERHAASLFSGCMVPTDASPLAQAYAGHQFGGFSPQLGDGRALLLGEIIDRQGARQDLQLKGSGPTPFSRGGDGRATLGPILREYLVGEAMHHLGVSTSRVLAAVSTGDSVRRDRWLPGAVLARVASSHLRVGTLEYFAAHHEQEKLSRLVDYALARHFPERVGCGNAAEELLRGVAIRQAELIASWMHVGFVHGVMNTDNVTLSGQTLDYGPCAFMDTYDPRTVFSSIDHHGRYAYGKQPTIGQWNLARMGESLLLLLSDDQDEAVAMVHSALELYIRTYQGAFLEGMRNKLGIRGQEEGDRDLIAGLLEWMESTKRDYTSTFRRLSGGLRTGEAPFCDRAFAHWSAAWRGRLGSRDPVGVAEQMDRVNPVYIPRNHLVESALDHAVEGDLGPFRTLLSLLVDPYSPQEGMEAYQEPAPEGAGRYRTFCGT